MVEYLSSTKSAADILIFKYDVLYFLMAKPRFRDSISVSGRRLEWAAR